MCGGDRLRQRPDLDDLEAGMPAGARAGRDQNARKAVVCRLPQEAIQFGPRAPPPPPTPTPPTTPLPWGGFWSCLLVRRAGKRPGGAAASVGRLPPATL